jgi:hypothetical protein
VSEKHCNFLINTGDGHRRRLETLGEEVRRRVKPLSPASLCAGRSSASAVQGVLELPDCPTRTPACWPRPWPWTSRWPRRVFATAAGLTMPEGMVVQGSKVLAGDPMPRPYVVKPIAEGSSVGVRIVREGDNSAADRPVETWTPAITVLVEPYIAGRELTVGVMGDKPLAGHRTAADKAASTTTKPSTPTASPSTWCRRR